MVNILYRKEHFIFLFRWLFFPIESSNTFQYFLLTSLKAFSNSDRLIVWSLSKLCFFNTWKRMLYVNVTFICSSIPLQSYPVRQLFSNWASCTYCDFFKIKRLIITYELFMTISIWDFYLKTKLDSIKVNPKKFNRQI